MRYARLPRFDVVTGIALAQQLAVLQGLPAKRDAVRRGAIKLQCKRRRCSACGWNKSRPTSRQSRHWSTRSPITRGGFCTIGWRRTQPASRPGYPEARAARILTSRCFPTGCRFWRWTMRRAVSRIAGAAAAVKDRGVHGRSAPAWAPRLWSKCSVASGCTAWPSGATPTPQTPPTPKPEPLRAMTPACCRCVRSLSRCTLRRLAPAHPWCDRRCDHRRLPRRRLGPGTRLQTRRNITTPDRGLRLPHPTLPLPPPAK